MYDYLIMFDPETGERRTTYAKNVHYHVDDKTKEPVGDGVDLDQALADDYRWVSEDDYQKLIGNTTGEEHVLDPETGEFIPKPPYVKPLEEAKTEKLTELKGIRDSKEIEPVRFYGHSYDFDTKSFDRINAAIIALDQTKGTIGWTTADNSVVEVTADTLRGVIAAAAVRSNALHITYRELKERVMAAATNDEVEAISWPEV